MTSPRSARRIFTGVALAAALLIAHAAEAGPAFFAGRLDGAGRFHAAEGREGPCFSVLFSTTTATVNESEARTRVEETVRGPRKGSLSTVVVVPLPRSAKEGDVEIRIDGRDGRALEARYLDESSARTLLRSVAKETEAPQVLALVGRPLLVVPSYELAQKAEVEIRFEHAVAREQGVLAYRVPMPAAILSAASVQRVGLQVELSAERPLRAVFSPTHAARVQRPSVTQARVEVTQEAVAEAEDFLLYFVAAADPLGLRVLTHRNPDDELGYFMVLGNPSGGDASEAVLAKDVVFALDTSGSMRGEKLEQARTALDYCLGQLNAGDRFNLITFGTDVRRFREDVVEGSPRIIEEALVFVDEVVARGRTNISGALAAGLAGEPAANRPRIMIFLTDGTPTAGELDPERIAAAVPDVNTSNTRVFALGVGHDVNAHLLDKVARQTSGSSEYVEPDEAIDDKVAALYRRLSHPLLTDVRLSFGDLDARQLYPEQLPDLFRGTELYAFGRYAGGGEHAVVLSGALRGQARDFRTVVDFPTASADGERPFIASLWASRRLGWLLEEIRLKGESEALVREVVEISRDHGIITEYTAFLAETGGDMEAPEAAAQALGLIRAANVHQSGAWAVRQAGNEKKLLSRIVTSNADNTFVDRRGRRKRSQKVKKVGGKVFYRKDDRWVQQSDRPAAAPARRVRRFSDEYFDLVEQDSDFAKAQSLEGDMDLEVSGERVHVY